MTLFRYPTSGPVFARAVELLALTDAFEPHEQKTLRRLGSETNLEGVGSEKRAELVRLACSALAGAPNESWEEAVRSWLAEWDICAAALNNGSVAPETVGLSVYPVVRLVALDVAVRLGAAEVLRVLQTTSAQTLVSAPRVNVRWLDRDACRGTFDHYRSRPLDQVAADAKLSLQTLQRWRSGEAASRAENLADAAAALAVDGKGTPEEIASALRFARAAMVLFPILDDWFGTEAVDQLVGAVRAVANRTLQLLLLERPLTQEALMRVELNGARSREGAALVEALAAATTHPGVRDDLRALSGQWGDRLRFWLQLIGTRGELLASLRRKSDLADQAEEYVGLARRARMWIGDPFAPRRTASIPESARAAVDALRATPEYRSNELVSAGLQACAAGDYARGIPALIEAVNLTPENGRRHFDLGAKLGDLAGHEEKALWHLRRAAMLMPDWPQPVTEIGIVLSNRDRSREAEDVFIAAEGVSSKWAHYQYARGHNAIQLGDFALAERCLRAALELDPRRDHARADLLLVLEQTKRKATLEARGLRKALSKKYGREWEAWIPRGFRPKR